MLLSQYIINLDFYMGLFSALIGCSIRYGDEYKKGKAKLLYYLIDAVTAIALGSVVYMYVTTEFGLSVVYAWLLNLVIGHVGSSILQVFYNVVIFNLSRNIKGMSEEYIKQLTNKMGEQDNDNQPIDDTKNIR